MTCPQDDDIPCAGAAGDIDHGTHHIDAGAVDATEDNIVNSSHHHTPDHIQEEVHTEEEEDAVQIDVHTHPDEGREEDTPNDCSSSYH